MVNNKNQLRKLRKRIKSNNTGEQKRIWYEKTETNFPKSEKTEILQKLQDRVCHEIYKTEIAKKITKPRFVPFHKFDNFGFQVHCSNANADICVITL